MTLDDMHIKIQEAILSREIQKAVDAVKTHSINDQSEIGERELRKILNQCLSGVSLQLQNTFVDQLRNFNLSNEITLFRTFQVSEVLAALETLKVIPNEGMQSNRQNQHSEIDQYFFGTEGAGKREETQDSYRLTNKGTLN